MAPRIRTQLAKEASIRRELVQDVRGTNERELQTKMWNLVCSVQLFFAEVTNSHDRNSSGREKLLRSN